MGYSTGATELNSPNSRVELRIDSVNDPSVNTGLTLSLVLANVEHVDALGTAGLVGTNLRQPAERNDGGLVVFARNGVDAQDLEADRGLGSLASNEGLAVGKGDAVERLAGEEVDRRRGVSELGGREDVVGGIDVEGGEERAD